MASETNVDIVMIGHFAKDRLVVDGKAEMAPGGAVYYGSIALRRLGVSVAVVTRLHPDDFTLLDELRQAGVEVFPIAAPETSGIENIYNSADMERRITHPLAFAGPFAPEDIPPIAARIYAVVPIMAGGLVPAADAGGSWASGAGCAGVYSRAARRHANLWPVAGDGRRAQTCDLSQGGPGRGRVPDRPGGLGRGGSRTGLLWPGRDRPDPVVWRDRVRSG